MGGLLVRDARRSETRTFYPGVWDVIGGHCEREETPADTLRREIDEEIGVTLSLDEAVALPLAHPAYPELFHAALRRRIGASRR